MEITEVKVFPISEEKLKAFVSIVLDGCFMVNDIKVIQGRDGLFISMPSRRKKSGEFKDVAHPLNNETRQMIEDRILDRYERVVVERGEAAHRLQRRARSAPAIEPDVADGGPFTERVVDGHSGSLADDRAVLRNPISVVEGELDDGELAAGEKSLEEVEEMHLRDSFWSVS